MGRPTRFSQESQIRKIKLTAGSDVRDKISATKLLIRLQNHALGLLNKPMDASQVSAAQILLRKLLPDLSSVDMKVEAGPFDGMDDQELARETIEAVKELQELKAFTDAESIIRRVQELVPAQAPDLTGEGTEEA